MSVWNKLSERRVSAVAALGKLKDSVAESTKTFGANKTGDVAKDASTAASGSPVPPRAAAARAPAADASPSTSKRSTNPFGGSAAADTAAVSSGNTPQTTGGAAPAPLLDEVAGDGNEQMARPSDDNDSAPQNGAAATAAGAGRADSDDDRDEEDDAPTGSAAAAARSGEPAGGVVSLADIADEHESASTALATKGSAIQVEPFSPQLQSAIAAVLPAKDPLDDPNFSSVAYINNLFPTEQSLADIDTAVSRVRIKVAHLDSEIVASVRQQALAADDGREHLQTASRSVAELFGKIHDIRNKADASETMVAEICRDITALDDAKRNLTAAITALKRLQMLTSGVAQLRDMQQRRLYDESSKMLGAVQLFVQYFADYHDVVQVRALKEDVEDLSESFKQQIYGEFEALLRGDPADDAARDAAYVIDALGAGVKQDFVLWFCDKQLGDYGAAFSPDSDSYGLEFTARRFEWWQRLSDAYDARWKDVFPPTWAMDERLAEEFCSQTKLALAATLQQQREQLVVGEMVAALQQCLAFERRLCERFHVDDDVAEAEARSAAAAAAAGIEKLSDSEESDHESEHEHSEAGDDGAGANAGALNPHSVEAVRQRYKTFQREKRRAEKAAERARQRAKRREEKFAGMVSAAFDAYLDLYIAQEDKQMSEVFERVTAQEAWPAASGDGADGGAAEHSGQSGGQHVLASATDLIYYFKKCRTRCAQLNKGQTLYEMFGLFRQYLFKYAGHLTSHVPADGSASTASAQSLRKMCAIITTADYCSTTAASISEGVKRVIKAKFHDQIGLKPAQTEFASIIAKAMKVVVTSLSALLAPSLLTMQKMPWGTWDGVGDTSEYVAEIQAIVGQQVPLINAHLSPAHRAYFADQFVGDFVPRVIQSLYKTKRISEAGAQHLLLDMSVLKSCLLRVPQLGHDALADGHGADDDDEAPSASRAQAKSKRYAKFVKRSMLKVEIVLKLVLAPQDALLASYKQMAGELQGAMHSDDLQRIMELRGVRQSEQRSFIAKLDSEPAATENDPTVTSRLKRLFSTADAGKKPSAFVAQLQRLKNTATPGGAGASVAQDGRRP